ncbi:hypothetical protein [Aquisalinus flavus]|uniref:Uncharacterized protein n=1 Tax=Aquisalinus flavus TaxID=1526572 RepID=A0A8J2V438_9PROT|nr:hypothetical protein [Aquisalinus flavus]MBD0426894.1 hypothetical protein [Aquisalinus flavus]GGC96794.1 hypothetical protein GCM10011342_02080 [Aquisalinus flavus]
MAHITDDTGYHGEPDSFFDNHSMTWRVLAWLGIGTVAAIVGFAGVIMTVNATPL